MGNSAYSSQDFAIVFKPNHIVAKLNDKELVLEQIRAYRLRCDPLGHLRISTYQFDGSTRLDRNNFVFYKKVEDNWIQAGGGNNQVMQVYQKTYTLDSKIGNLLNSIVAYSNWQKGLPHPVK